MTILLKGLGIELIIFKIEVILFLYFLILGLVDALHLIGLWCTWIVFLGHFLGIWLVILLLRETDLLVFGRTPLEELFLLEHLDRLVILLEPEMHRILLERPVARIELHFHVDHRRLLLLLRLLGVVVFLFHRFNAQSDHVLLNHMIWRCELLLALDEDVVPAYHVSLEFIRQDRLVLNRVTLLKRRHLTLACSSPAIRSVDRVSLELRRDIVHVHHLLMVHRILLEVLEAAKFAKFIVSIPRFHLLDINITIAMFKIGDSVDFLSTLLDLFAEIDDLSSHRSSSSSNCRHFLLVHDDLFEFMVALGHILIFLTVFCRDVIVVDLPASLLEAHLLSNRLLLLLPWHLLFLIVIEVFIILIVDHAALLELIIRVVVLRHDAKVMVLELRVVHLVFVDDASDGQTISPEVFTGAAAVEERIEGTRHREETLIWIEFAWTATEC